MREFKVWDKKKKIMYPFEVVTGIDLFGGYVEFGEEWDTGEYMELLWDKVLKLSGCDLPQYTGLKDKNGVEVYEGDIIFWKDLSESSDGTLEDVVSVFFDDEHLRWSVETYGSVKAYESLYNYSNVDEIEVIGNIYQNPELLEVKDES